MTLGTFTPRTRISGDKIDLRQSQWYGRPMLMRCNEFSDSFSSKMNQGEIKEAVWVDVVDLISGTILINVLFTSGALVDNLKEHAGTEVTLPVKIAKVAGGRFGGYAVLEALSEQEQVQAGQWYQQYWGLVDQERAKREAAARPLQNQAPAQGGFPAAQGFNPAQGQQQAPAQGQAFGQPNQGLPHDQGQFNQPPAQGFGAPAGAGPMTQAAPQYQQQSPAQGFGQPNQAPSGYDQQMQAQGGQFQQPNQAPAQGFGQPNQGQQFGNPQQGQAPANGMFTDAPPVADPNQGFQAPNPQQMLNQLNGQLS